MKKNGFTLLEVIFVVVILLIFTGIVATNIRPLVANIRLQSVTNSIKHQLICAKTRALGDSRIQCGIFFDTSSTPHKVQTFFDNDSAGTRGFYDAGVDRVYMQAFIFPPTISLKITGSIFYNAIVFRGDGSTRPNDLDISVYTNNTDKKQERIISVLPSTGRIRISRP